VPRGRPKGALNKSTKDIKALAGKYTPQALDTLVKIMAKSESDAARVSAAKELLDRGHGKAAQPLTDAAGGPLTVIVRKFADA
jgi:HEAT repeat protein